MLSFSYFLLFEAAMLEFAVHCRLTAEDFILILTSLSKF